MLRMRDNPHRAGGRGLEVAGPRQDVGALVGIEPLGVAATNDVDALSELFASGVLNAVGDLVSLIGIVVAMLLLDWSLALIAFASLPLVGIFVFLIRRGGKRAYRDIRTKTARLNAFLSEQVGGISVVQAYAREEAMAREFDSINIAYRDANKRAIYYEAVLDAEAREEPALAVEPASI